MRTGGLESSCKEPVASLSNDDYDGTPDLLCSLMIAHVLLGTSVSSTGAAVRRAVARPDTLSLNLGHRLHPRTASNALT